MSIYVHHDPNAVDEALRHLTPRDSEAGLRALHGGIIFACPARTRLQTSDSNDLRWAIVLPNGQPALLKALRFAALDDLSLSIETSRDARSASEALFAKILGAAAALAENTSTPEVVATPIYTGPEPDDDLPF